MVVQRHSHKRLLTESTSAYRNSRDIETQTNNVSTDCGTQTFETFASFSTTNTFRPFRVNRSTQTKWKVTSVATQTKLKLFQSTGTQTDEDFTKMSAEIILSLEEKKLNTWKKCCLNIMSNDVATVESFTLAKEVDPTGK